MPNLHTSYAQRAVYFALSVRYNCIMNNGEHTMQPDHFDTEVQCEELYDYEPTADDIAELNDYLDSVGE